MSNIKRESKTEVPRVLFGLKGDWIKERINGVSWVETQDGRSFLIAISVDKTLTCWKAPNSVEDVMQEWQQTHLEKI